MYYNLEVWFIAEEHYSSCKLSPPSHLYFYPYLYLYAHVSLIFVFLIVFVCDLYLKVGFIAKEHCSSYKLSPPSPFYASSQMAPAPAASAHIRNVKKVYITKANTGRKNSLERVRKRSQTMATRSLQTTTTLILQRQCPIYRAQHSRSLVTNMKWNVKNSFNYWWIQLWLALLLSPQINHNHHNHHFCHR